MAKEGRRSVVAGIIAVRRGERASLIRVAVVLLIVGACAASRRGPAEAFAQSPMTLTHDGAWCWFGDPRVVFHAGLHRRFYAGWVNRSGDIEVAFYDEETKKSDSETLRKNLDADDHANPSLLVLPDGRLMVFYAGHGGPEMNYRIAAQPEQITAWGEEKTIGTNTGRSNGYTYPNPIQLSQENGRIYLFWRGGNWKPSFAYSDNVGVSWSRAQTMIQDGGARPYIKYASKGRDRIHMAFTDGHPRNEAENNIYYACYREGAFYRADGSKIVDIGDLPFEPSQADRIYDASAHRARAWIHDIAIDAQGRPVVAYAAFPRETDHRYRYARWGGESWEDREITPAGGWFPQTPKGKKESEPHYSGGLALDPIHPEVVYLSRPTGGVFEIERWITSDGGASWSSAMLTEGSSRNNLRPVVAVDSRDSVALVLWMHGDYVHYTKFQTDIRMMIVGE